MDAEPRKQLLQELFGNQESGIQISYLRISLGASDLSSTVYTYNDLPIGQIDESLQQFDPRIRRL
jgi:glucosylceramidase